MIKAEDLYVSYDGTEIIHGISLTVNNGEFLSIMGKSGSGKSTLLNTLAGNIIPDSGHVTIDGEDITAMSDKELSKLRRTKLGFVYQSLNLIPTLSGRDNIMLPIYLDKADRNSALEELSKIAELLEIAPLLDKLPGDMSGGERQRVAIAKSLIHSPEIIMLDEPTGSLDSKNAMKVMELLSRINSESGVSIIQVTHNKDSAMIGHRTVEIQDGILRSN